MARLAWGWAMAPYEAGEVGIHKSSLNFVDSVTEVHDPVVSCFRPGGPRANRSIGGVCYSAGVW